MNVLQIAEKHNLFSLKDQHGRLVNFERRLT